MSNLRIGIVGFGNMGKSHARYLQAGKVKNATLTAIFDIAPKKLKWAQEHLGENVETFADEEAFYSSGKIDAVIIATPHFDHPAMARKAFTHGLHVLCEKPAGVYTKQVREMNESAKKSGKVFGMMYNQRTNPLYQKLRELIQSGELGEIRRMNWIITTWYRSQSYYESGGWRATWSGEGGGVLINQCPHQLDLWQWVTGMMPKRIRAFCSFGKYRNIEVEDEVTAYAEYENGATGVFITSIAEAPGSNRLEITGERGKVVVEGDQLTFWRLRVSETQFNQEYQGGFGSPEYWKCEVPIHGEESGHQGITNNFVNAVLDGSPLLAPGEEGIKGLMLSNAMHMSAWTDDWVELPIDEALYYQKLQEKIQHSSLNKETKDITLDVEGTF